jgi:glutamate racemase
LRQVLGDQVALVDSAEETSRTVEAMLNGHRLPRQSDPAGPRFFVTDIPTRFVRVGGAFLGRDLNGVTQVSLD